MAELVLFIGLQAAGKSTFYRSRFAATHLHVSKDLLRHNPSPERRQQVLLREALEAGRNVVVDNTNPTPDVRAPLIALGREFRARIVGFWFQVDLADSIRRNRLREGRQRIPDVGIYATAKRLKPPSIEEGFDELHHVRLNDRTGQFELCEVPSN